MIRNFVLVGIIILSVVAGSSFDEEPIENKKEPPTQTITFEPMLMPLECLEDGHYETW